ncbi:MAG TPA: glycosyltransferase [Candidatus Limnocylindrales bacterium]|nr:glycosyltransferase [Candidatus Limnocylindrales bacterium]
MAVSRPEPQRGHRLPFGAGRTRVFADGRLPAPESPGQRLLIHAAALIALAITTAYLVWRVAAGTIDLAWWWVAVPLFLVELHNAFGLGLFTVALWSMDGSSRPPLFRRHSGPAPRIAVLIPTYNEPQEVLLPTIAAAVALTPAHETWVLDDGRRPEIRRLAESLGARYLDRPDNRHAKAGNLNHALDVVEADIVAVLDADHVPTARFLSATLPYFDDPEIAFVQTPQDFYNLESFEHEHRGDGQPFNEEAVFYRVIAPAKSRWSAPFWCGTCALVRVSALRSVGGVATDSVTEDIETTIRLYRRGWRGAYHNEVLARGLAPDDAAAYLLQRHRWALGAMQVLRGENPLFGPGLDLGQRVAFMTTLFGWFDSWRTLAFILIPLAVVATGAVPIAAPGAVFGPLFALTLSSQFIALRLLARGRYPPLLSLLFEMLRMPAVLPATLALVTPGREHRFEVTPKGANPAGRARIRVPRLLSVLAAASAGGLVWFTATLAGLTPIRYGEPWAAIGAACFLAGNLALLLAAIGRIRSPRFSGNRRVSVRLPIVFPARIGQAPARLRDLSVTGARVDVPTAMAPAEGAQVVLELTLPDGRARLASQVRRSIGSDEGSQELGLAFAPDQEREVARLAVAVFGPDDGPGPAVWPAEARDGLTWLGESNLAAR